MAPAARLKPATSCRRASSLCTKRCPSCPAPGLTKLSSISGEVGGGLPSAPSPDAFAGPFGVSKPGARSGGAA